MIVLRTPKGWTGPKEVDGKPVEGTFRAHQVPMGEMDRPEHLKHPGAVDEELPAGGAVRRPGRLRPELAELAPKGTRRMSANPHANGGLAAEGPAAARLPRLRRRGARARGRQGRGHPRPGAVPPRRDEAQRRGPQLPHLRPRRDGLQPLERRLRGHRPPVHRRDPARRRPRRRPRAG